MSLYALVRFVIGGAVDAFYRPVVLDGAIPAEGPVLLVANHPNGLVDPAVVANLAPRPVRMLAKAPLFSMPVLGAVVRAAQALPVYRTKDGADTKHNERTFIAVGDALRARGCVLIFPEGISHDEPSLQPLKTGAARMALAAVAAGVNDLVIVPVGLTYADKQRFRSTVAASIGPPLRVPPNVDARTLTADIDAALRAVTVNLERWEDLPLLKAVDAIWRIDDADRSARLKELADGTALLRAHEPVAFAATRDAVAAWSERLSGLGLAPRDLRPEHDPVRTSFRRATAFIARALAVLVVGLPVALAGAVWFFVPFWLVHGLSLAMRPTRDVAATVKVLASIVFFPLWHVLATATVAWTAGAWWALVCGTLLPLGGMTTRWFFAGRARAARDVVVLARLWASPALNRALDVERDALLLRFDALAERVRVLRAQPQASGGTSSSETASPSGTSPS